MLDSLAAAIGVKKLVILGSLGGALAAMAVGPKRIWAERTVNFAVGLPAALFLTEPIVTYYDLGAKGYEGGIGFMLGCFAWVIADRLVQLIRDTEFSALLALLKRGK